MIARDFKPKISFIYGRGFPSYIKRDRDILCKSFIVESHSYSRVFSLWPIAKSVIRTNLSIVWFANELTAFVVLLSKIFKKKVIVITGGSMVLCDLYPNCKAIGVYYRLSHRIAAKYVAGAADILLTVSKYELKGILKNNRPKNIRLCYHGFEIEKFYPNEIKKNIVLTTSETINKEYFEVKDLDKVLKVAKLLPKLQFIILGRFADNEIESFMKRESPPNVLYPGFVSGKELLNYFQKSKVYIQLSRHEGFGCAIAEAMLCECTPVVTENGAIPEVVGEEGYYVSTDNIEGIAHGIKLAISNPKGKTARKRIIKEFPIEKRVKTIKDIINHILN